MAWRQRNARPQRLRCHDRKRLPLINERCPEPCSLAAISQTEIKRRAPAQSVSRRSAARRPWAAEVNCVKIPCHSLHCCRSPALATRRDILIVGAALAVWLRDFRALAAEDPAATLRSLYDALLTVMKDARRLGFDGRRQRLAPVIAQAFDLPLMTRLVIGLEWPSLSPEDQRQLVAAFTELTVASYASQYDDYSGQRFEVDPRPAPAPDGDLIVKTKVIRASGEPVPLDYLLRQEQGHWRIIDVLFSGTVSQLAARRSEFTAILRNQGAPGLIASLKQKIRSLATGNG